ncbi:hypothetical protein OSSY52_05230 [Tepiditoga spiralis]|uniref:Uncharacterized protein n=1 Tax=Tepiditoga spiralis TaxID=2108365 RepID=A0A7G1G8L6_9BACT|nr:hypothetical protein [Tepiditoga spiralis]BBE30382.1 hypothetical protein OSSY52_05230 [Tepiditoga spiralis]
MTIKKNKVCIGDIDGFIKPFKGEFELKKQYFDEIINKKIVFFELDKNEYFICSKKEYLKHKFDYVYDEFIPIQIILYFLKKEGTFKTEFGIYTVVKEDNNFLVFKNDKNNIENIQNLSVKNFKDNAKDIFKIKSYLRKGINIFFSVFIIFLIFINIKSGINLFTKFNYELKKEKQETNDYNQYSNLVQNQKKRLSEFFDYLNKIDAKLITFNYSGIKLQARVILRMEYGKKIMGKYAIKEISRLEFDGYGYAILDIFEGD